MHRATHHPARNKRIARSWVGFTAGGGGGGGSVVSEKRSFRWPYSFRSLGCFSKVRSQLRHFDELGTSFVQGVRECQGSGCSAVPINQALEVFFTTWPVHKRYLAFRAWSEMGFHKLRHPAAVSIYAFLSVSADCKVFCRDTTEPIYVSASCLFGPVPEASTSRPTLLKAVLRNLTRQSTCATSSRVLPM